VRSGLLAAVVAMVAAPAALRSQDSSAAAPGGVRVGITYTPGTRPSVTVLPVAPAAPALDSVRTILLRDLDFSDRFDLVVPPPTVVAQGGAPNYAALTALGTDLAVAVVPAPGAGQGGRVNIQLHDVRTRSLKGQLAVPLPAGTGEALRLAVHRAADEVVRWATGSPGIASTAILYVADGRLWRVDPDGEGRASVPSAGRPALSPAWSPDGRMFVYTAFVPSGRPLVIQDLASGSRDVVPGSEYGVNITPEFSPDGRALAFAHGDENGTDIYLYDVGRHCCVTRLTVGRFYDNLSPTWSPDGGRIAFISTRAGSPQLYAMSADGSGQEALARFDYGFTGQTNGPEWSPDGQAIAFHREVHGVPQLFVLDLATRAVRQITGEGRNEDPTWAPDGRHLAFVSSRSGTRQLWIVDLETGRMRPIVTTGGARLPAWSPRRTFFSEAG
jgi:TolB protein